MKNKKNKMSDEMRFKFEFNSLMIVSLALVFLIISNYFMAVFTDINIAEKLFTSEIHLAIIIVLILSSLLKISIKEQENIKGKTLKNIIKETFNK